MKVKFSNTNETYTVDHSGANKRRSEQTPTVTFLADGVKRRKTGDTESVSPLMERAINTTGTPSASAAKKTTPAMTETATDRANRIRAFGAGSYSGGGNLLTKAAQSAAAGALGAASGLAEIAAQATPTDGTQNLGQFAGFGDLGRAVREGKETSEDITAIVDRIQQQRSAEQKASQANIYGAADKLSQRSAELTEQAKEGTGKVGSFLVDLGVTGTQMAGDALANVLLPGSGLAAMGARVYGQSAGDARREGKTEGQQALAGLKSATIEILTEKLFGGLARAYGAGTADELVEKIAEKLTKSDTGKHVATWLINSGGEGIEEVLSDIANPVADRVLGLDDGEGNIFTSDDAAQMGYDFLLGAAMGAIGGAGQLRRNNFAWPETAQSMQEEATPTQSQQVKNVSMEAQPTEVQAVPTVQAADLGAEAPTVRFESAEAETPTPTAETRTARQTGGNTKGFGENGREAYATVQREYGGDSETYQGFAVAYNAGLSGVSPSLVQTNVPETVRSAAYQAGLNDRVANMRKSNEAVKRVTVKKGAGLLRNEYASKLTESNKDIANTLNTIGKAVGVSIEIVDSVADGRANGEYNADTNTIRLAMDAENPILTVTAHEVTHRIQTLAPAEYEAFSQAAAEYYAKEYGVEGVTALVNAYKEVAKANGVTLTNETAMDEMAADFTETLLNDADLFERFTKENRTAAQKLLDALKEFLAKVKATLTGKARDAAAQNAYGKNFSELEQIAQKWQTAYDAAVERAKNAETAANEGGGVKYSHKGYWKPRLTKTEWELLRYEMETNGTPLDESTNWVYADKKGEQVFAVYGIGDGTENTPLYVTTGEEARQDYKRLSAYIRGATKYDGSQEFNDSLVNEYWRVKRNRRTDRLATEDGRSGNGTAGLHGGAQRGKGGRIVGEGESNRRTRYSLKSKDNPYLAAVKTGDTATAQKLVDEAAKNAGYTIHAYHGTARADRVGTVFRPDRATSGPMAFFTDSRSIAENYARDKADTSIAYDTEYDDYYTQFRVTRNGKSLSVGELWNHLTPVERAKIKEAAPHIRFDEDYDKIIYDPAAQHGNGAYDAYELNRNKGNALNALVSTWLETGDLYDREADFLDVLKLAGVKDVEYRNPDARNEKVYDTYLKIQHPFDTATAGREFYNDLSAWLEETDISQYQRENFGADMWDKNAVTPERFLERLSGDIEKGTTHAWTSIPDYVTAYLQERDYDGIKDTGGKNGGESHTVWIPFSSEQVKSAEAVVYDDDGNVIPLSERFNEGRTDIRYSLKSYSQIEQELKDLKKERTRLASRNKALEQRVEDLKGEMRITREPTLVAKDVQKLGRQIIRQYDSDAKYSDIERDMDALAKAIMKKDVSMSDLMPHAKSAAETIIDNTTYMTEDGQFLREIRQYLRDHIVVLNNKPDGYDYIRKKYAGTLYLATQVGQSKTKHYIATDVLYEDMAEMFGEAYFPKDVYDEGNKLERIIEVVDALSDNSYANPYDGYREIAVNDLAGQLIDGIISEQVRQKRTFADKKAFEQQEAVGRVRQLLTKEREKRKTRERELKQQFAGKTREIREKQSAKEMRQRIAKHTSALSDKLLHPTDNKHIPEVLRKPVAELLNSINLESAYSYDENGRLRKDANGDPTQRTLAAVKLRKAYSQVMQGDDAVTVDPALLEEGGLLDTVEGLSDKRVADMTTSELQTVWEAIRAIEASISSYNRTLSNGKYQKISDWAERIKSESSTRKRRNRSFSLELLDPYSFFTAYGDAGKQVYRTLRDAQDLEHVRVRELTERSKKVFDKDVYKQRNERHEYTTERGDKVTLTTAQLMNLYNLARRGEQAMNHLMVGGIAQPEIERNGKQKAIPRGEANIPLTEGDIRAMTDMLTPEQKKMADGYQKLASSLLAEWGNEASMQVYGYRKFTEENYWPIRVSKEATMQNAEKTGDTSREIKNMGSAKALVPNASNALDIGSIYDVFSQNASDMVKYSTLLAPMEDINRLFNYRYRDGMGNLTNRNFKQVLTSAYGDKAQKYWLNLMRDVQNGLDRTSSESSKVVERLVGNAKAAAVGANLRVVIQQPTAIVRAAAILNPENMAKGLKSGATKGNGWEKAKKYAPIASIKNTAGFDQGGRYTIAHELYGAEGWMEQLNDATSWAAAKADAVTWGKIWNACEWQVAEDTTLKKGSEEFYSEVAKLFTEVIDQSQVVDGIMQRPAIMRDGNAAVKQATAFMGEPLKAVNMLVRAYDAWVYETDTKKRSEALKTLKRSVSALAATTIVNALAQSIVDALRDDDKDEKYMERLLTSLTGADDDEENTFMSVMSGNIASGFNPLEYIPIAKDAWSILQGYSVDRMDAELISDFVSAVQAFGKAADGRGKKTTAYAAKQLIFATAKVFGISATNAGRDIWAIARSVAIETGNVRMMYEMERAIYRIDKTASNRSVWCTLLYMAQNKGDNETARLIYKDMLANGYEEKDVRQGVETIMKKEQGVSSVDDLKSRWKAPY